MVKNGNNNKYVNNNYTLVDTQILNPISSEVDVIYTVNTIVSRRLLCRVMLLDCRWTIS